MFHDTALSLQPNAERIAALAISLLASVDEDQQLEIFTRLDDFFNALAESLGYKRALVRFGSDCARFVWLPQHTTSIDFLTDIDFFCQTRFRKHPKFLALSRLLSRNRRRHAHRLVVCLVIARDWHLGDLESIQQADELMNRIQLCMAREAARTRAGQRFGGSRKPNETMGRWLDESHLTPPT